MSHVERSEIPPQAGNTLNESLLQFRKYLQGKKYSEETIRKSVQQVQHFLEWAMKEKLKSVNYQALMDYVRYCQGEGKQNAMINRYLISIRHYFNQKETWPEKANHHNPAKGLHLRGTRKKLTTDYLEKEELEELYRQYTGKEKILIGLMVYQGLRTGELERLEKKHFDLKAGTVYIIKSKGSNSRTLKLESVQVYELMNHLQELTRQLLFSSPLQNKIRSVIKSLRKYNKKVRNLKQIRGSVITHWIKTKNLREAQYLAGHYSIAGTELYKQADLEGLQEEVNKFHPLG